MPNGSVCKFSFPILLLVCAASSDVFTRALAALFASIGCGLYFATMYSPLKLMDTMGDVRPGMAEENAMIVICCVVLWFCAFTVELNGLLTQPCREPSVPATVKTQRLQLVARPQGLVSLEDFEICEEVIDTTALKKGEAVVECEMLSVDAFLRTMLDAEAFNGAIPLGSTGAFAHRCRPLPCTRPTLQVRPSLVVPALGYGRVVASSNPNLKRGSRVIGMVGACSHAKLSREEAAAVKPLPALPRVPPVAFLGLLGFNCGLTAWVGIYSVTKPPRRGEVVVVSAASGATGSVAAQLAKQTGAKVIGIAGGEAKIRYLLDELGLDGAVDYKSEKTVGEQVDALCPNGVDFYFDAVGGDILDAVMLRIRTGGRIVVCGAASQYNGNLNVGKVQGPSHYLKLAERGATMVGFNVMSYSSTLPIAMAHLYWLIMRNKVFITEQIEPGVASFAPAMIKMFTGGHRGKLLVDPTASRGA